jgi:hypothetical protein
MAFTRTRIQTGDYGKTESRMVEEGKDIGG